MIKSLKELNDAVADMEPGRHEFETVIGPVTINKGETGRRTYYVDGSRINQKDLKIQLAEAPEPAEEPESVEAPAGPLNLGQLTKKYKKKKLLKVLPESGLLKKKKMAKLIDSIEKLAPKKVQGHEILAAIHAVKDDVKAEKIIALFDQL